MPSRQDGAVPPTAYCPTGLNIVHKITKVPKAECYQLSMAYWHPASLMWGDGMDLMNKYPRLTDLEAPAARRIPKFVFAYLDSGTGQDHAKDNNRAYLDGIELTPQFMRGRVNPDLSTQIAWRHI